MTQELWVVTHATESGATRLWWVDGVSAAFLQKHWDEIAGRSTAGWCSIKFQTLTGRALIWLTPGQSLTVEKHNG